MHKQKELDRYYIEPEDAREIDTSYTDYIDEDTVAFEPGAEVTVTKIFAENDGSFSSEDYGRTTITKNVKIGEPVMVSTNRHPRAWAHKENPITSKVTNMYRNPEDGSVFIFTATDENFILKPAEDGDVPRDKFIEDLQLEVIQKTRQILQKSNSEKDSFDESTEEPVDPFTLTPGEVLENSRLEFEGYISTAIRDAERLIKETKEDELQNVDWSQYPELEWATRLRAQASGIIETGDFPQWSPSEKRALMIINATRLYKMDGRKLNANTGQRGGEKKKRSIVKRFLSLFKAA